MNTQAPGASGTRVLQFRATKPSLFELCLVNRQEWEPQNPAEYFRVKILVE
jgi:hypothetical protein